MTTPTFDAALLSAQRELRGALLANAGSLSWSRSRELAAMMLLNLDDVQGCWTVALQWMLEQFGVDRVDGGFHSPHERFYVPTARAAVAEDVPAMARSPIDTHEAGVASLWVSNLPIAFDDASGDPRFSASLRALVQRSHTASKLATSVRHQRKPVGLICLDQLDRARSWTDQDMTHLRSAAEEVLAPILDRARRLAAESGGAASGGDPVGHDELLRQLTASEDRVARLVASGLSYKEIARELGRSHSTIDHHLRSIRQKLGVSSTSKLIRVLAEALPQQSR